MPPKPTTPPLTKTLEDNESTTWTQTSWSTCTHTTCHNALDQYLEASFVDPQKITARILDPPYACPVCALGYCEADKQKLYVGNKDKSKTGKMFNNEKGDTIEKPILTQIFWSECTHSQTKDQYGKILPVTDPFKQYIKCRIIDPPHACPVCAAGTPGINTWEPSTFEPPKTPPGFWGLEYERDRQALLDKIPEIRQRARELKQKLARDRAKMTKEERQEELERERQKKAEKQAAIEHEEEMNRQDDRETKESELRYFSSN